MNRATVEKGFSLIEVLIAMVLLATMAIFLEQLMLAGIQLNHISNDETRLNGIANDRVEQLKNMRFNTLGVPCIESNTVCGSLTSNYTDTSVTPAVQYFDSSIPSYTVRWTVSIPSGTTNMRRITVRVISNRLNAIGKQRELILYFDRAKF